MADSKISALTAATTPLAGTEVLPIVQSGVTKKVAVSDLTAGRAVSMLSATLTGGTVNGIAYLDGSKVVTTGSALTFNGTTLNTTGQLYAGGDNGFTSDVKVSGTAGNGGCFLFKNTAGSNQWLGWMWNASTSGDGLFINFMTEGGGTGRGSIIYNRGAGLLNYNVTSDYRSKDIIGPVENAGSVIDSLKIYMGKMKGATMERPMLIAHEAQTVTPYAVTGKKDAVDKDGNPVYQQVDHSSYIPLMLAEMQSLRARMAAVESKN